MRKGITATSVAIMVLIIMILIGTITTLSYNSMQNAKKIVFALEISSIQEIVNKYVTDSSLGEYPVLANEHVISLTSVSNNSAFQFNDEDVTTNDEITVYELDLSILGITDTTYGNKKTDKDVYVVSKTTGKVYYLEGIKAKNITYYTLTEDLLELDEKRKTSNEESYKKPMISTDGYITKKLLDGTEEVYLTNIKVTNNPKIFKYELGVIAEDNAKVYFKDNGKTIASDRIKLEEKTEVTLYAENEIGEYTLYYCNVN